jgi:hypothetical protein
MSNKVQFVAILDAKNQNEIEKVLFKAILVELFEPLVTLAVPVQDKLEFPETYFVPSITEVDAIDTSYTEVEPLYKFNKLVPLKVLESNV